MTALMKAAQRGSEQAMLGVVRQQVNVGASVPLGAGAATGCSGVLGKRGSWVARSSLEDRLILARRFNAGESADRTPVPLGTAETLPGLGDSFQVCLRHT